MQRAELFYKDIKSLLTPFPTSPQGGRSETNPFPFALVSLGDLASWWPFFFATKAQRHKESPGV